jgi:hypothetical protein
MPHLPRAHSEKHHVTRLRPSEGLQAVSDERDLKLSSALMSAGKKKQALLDRRDHV